MKVKVLSKKVFKTKDHSFLKYYKYVNNHIRNIRTACNEFGLKICNDIYRDKDEKYRERLFNEVKERVQRHDASKFNEEEFVPYVQKFYPWKSMNKSSETIDLEFSDAWTHHILLNDHHPEHWLITTAEEKIKMHDAALVEMLLDWIAMSIGLNQNMYEWWNNNYSGKSHKMNLMHIEDFIKVDNWINKNKLDFSKCNSDNK